MTNPMKFPLDAFGFRSRRVQTILTSSFRSIWVVPRWLGKCNSTNSRDLLEFHRIEDPHFVRSGCSHRSRSYPHCNFISSRTYRQYCWKREILNIAIQNIALAATFNESIVERVGYVTGRDSRIVGINYALAPVADVGVEPRWGRFYETVSFFFLWGFFKFITDFGIQYGDSPYEVTTMVRSILRGLHGFDATDRFWPAGSSLVASATKHFLGYGQPNGGVDRADATVMLCNTIISDQYLIVFRYLNGSSSDIICDLFSVLSQKKLTA